MTDRLHPEGAASLVAPSGASGVPVIDLTGLVTGLYAAAEEARIAADRAQETADALRAHTDAVAGLAGTHRRQCDHLEAVAAALEGMTR